MGSDFRYFQEMNWLYHSGIKGMRWGIRRYQNKDGSLTPAGRARYNAGSGPNASRSDRKFAEKINRDRAKTRMESLEKARIAKLEKKARDADKERVLKEGTAQEILKYKTELTNQELASALNRVKWTNELTSISKQELEKGWQTIDNIMKKISMVNNWTSTGINTYKNVDQIKKIFDSISKSSANSSIKKK